jgi:hypothetical protein
MTWGETQLSADPSLWKRIRSELVIVGLGLVAIGLGALVGGGSSLYYYADLQQDCALPVNSSITQVIDFSNNQPDRSVDNTVTVKLPSPDWRASVLAGQSSSRKERLRALQCVFGSMPNSPADVTQKDRMTSITIHSAYIAYGFVKQPSVNEEGLKLAAPTYADAFDGFGRWPEGTYVTLQVKAPGRHVMYSQPPAQRKPGQLTWAWTLTSTGNVNHHAKDMTITVPLGTGEHVTAFLQYSGNLHFYRHVSSYDINLDFYANPLLGFLGAIAATLSLLLTLGWYSHRRKVATRWCALSAALLLPVLPLLGSVYVYWYGWPLPLSTALLLACIVLSGLFFLRALGSTPLREHRPPLTGRSAGVVACLPLATLPLVALALVLSILIPRRPSRPPGPAIPGIDPWAPPVVITNIILVSILLWAVSALVLIFTRSSLRAISTRTTYGGPRKEADEIGVATARWYRVASGVVIIGSAYAVGYGLAHFLGKAFNAYYLGAASGASASGELATEISAIAVYPVLFLVLPVAATLVAATISSKASASVMTPGVVAMAALAWATTSRALSLNVAGTSLPVGAWILTVIVWLGLRKTVRDSAKWQTEPWLPVRKPPQAASSSRVPFRTRLGRWLAQEKREVPKDPPPPATCVKRGPFRDPRARAYSALAWATLLSVVPVAYLIWGTLRALPKNGSDPVNASFVVSQVVAEVVRWTLAGWLYGLLIPVLPGRVGPVKALWLSGAWFAASAPVVIVDGWTGADPGRGWLFPGLQLLLFLTVLAVLMDLSTVEVWAGGRFFSAANRSTLLDVYNFDDARKIVLYVAPAIAAIIVIGQQVVTGTSLDFVNSILSGAQNLFSSGAQTLIGKL